MVKSRDITDALVLYTEDESIKDAYDNKVLSVCVQDGGIWYIDKCATEELHKRVEIEMNRIFPTLIPYIDIT